MNHRLVRTSYMVAVSIAAVFVATGVAMADSGVSVAAGGFQGPLGPGARQIIAFSATQSQVGNAAGHLTERIMIDGENVAMLTGDADCLAVSGHTAAVSFLVTDVTGFLQFSYPVGSTAILLVDDDEAGDTFAFTSGSDGCATVLNWYQPPFYPIAGGNVTIRP